MQQAGESTSGGVSANRQISLDQAERAKALESAAFRVSEEVQSDLQGVTPAEALNCCLLLRLLLIWAVALSAARAEGTVPGDGSEGSPWRRLKAHALHLLRLR